MRWVNTVRSLLLSKSSSFGRLSRHCEQLLWGALPNLPTVRSARPAALGKLRHSAGITGTTAVPASPRTPEHSLAKWSHRDAWGEREPGQVSPGPVSPGPQQPPPTLPAPGGCIWA